MAISYKDSGVDVTRGYKAVELMKKHVKSTYDNNVIGDLGSFGGFYSIAGEKMEEPVLVAGTDGVGTKLKYAFLLEKHDTIGIDAVAMCVNDIVCQGAKPLFFLDYYACGRLYPESEADVVKGIAEGCRQAGCALIGGETAEMPGFYPDGEYDLAGFAVGIVDKKKVINGKNITAGDVLIGIKSTGVHSNGYSLVRKLFGDSDKAALEAYDEELGASAAEVLLKPTKIYVKSILSLIEKVEVKGIAHITGGGFIENIPRILPEGVAAQIDKNSYEVPPVFKVVQKRAGITDEQIYNTFNMGIGMVVCVSPENVEKALDSLKATGEDVVVIGKTVAGKGSFSNEKNSGIRIGGGTDFQSIIDANECERFCQIEYLVASKPEIGAIKRAEKHGIKTLVYDKNSMDKESFYQEVANTLKAAGVEYIVLAGWLLVVPASFIKGFENAIINIHPSLIPSFCGMGYYGLKVHEKAIEYGVKLSGATVHFVEADVDGGAIIMQRAVPVLPEDTAEVLQQRILKEEHQMLPLCVKLLCEDKIRKEGRKIYITE